MTSVYLLTVLPSPAAREVLCNELATQLCRDTLLHIDVVDIICVTTGVRAGPEA